MKQVVLLIGECEAVKSVLLSSLEEKGFFIDKTARSNSLVEVVKNQESNLLAFSLPLKNAKETILSLKEEKDISLTSFLFSSVTHCFLSSYKAKETIQLMECTYPYVDAYFDIDGLSKESLKEIVVNRLITQKQRGPLLVFSSFGYKHGLPGDADFVFDCRSLPNPFWVPELRPLNGLDQPVIDFLSKQEEVDSFIQETTDYLKQRITAATKKGQPRLMIYFGCTGGQHRSVYLTNEIAKQFASFSPMVLHRDLKKGGCHEE